MNNQPTTETREAQPSRWSVIATAAAAGFLVYFAMYAFRKPFTAATYAGEGLWGSGIELKTTFVIAQIIGYALSKYLGIDLCTRIPDRFRAWALLGLISIAEFALVLFAVLPLPGKVFAIFLNGVPLGMVWGLVIRYLEGRRSSDLLLACLCCSFIVSSGVVKDVGRGWINAGVDPYWMPAVTGLCFLPMFLLALGMLLWLPAPSAADIQSRSKRGKMSTTDRWSFVRSQWNTLWPLLLFYTGLTAYRDFRDNYSVEILNQLGYAEAPAIFSRMELPVALFVTLTLGALILVQNHRHGLAAIYTSMLVGMALIFVSTSMSFAGMIPGLTWMILVGLGSYLAYVPFNAVLFERLVALRGAGSAVFGIYLADALGYTGSIGVQLYKDLGADSLDRLTFFQHFSFVLSVIGMGCLVVSGLAILIGNHKRALGTNCTSQPSARPQTAEVIS
ncbi:hypothetical protein HOV93_07820 [Planctomycetes bacterium FF15]|uniref:MFS transporter n=1 Tax=Bremerella alba TaxID=980252 RepID=A0A7V9A5U2_9BACT|nr:hypothetical protein [Bremerella alba]